MIDYKLHIPGPVDVSPENVYNAMSTRVMGHRSTDFVDLYQSCQPNLQKLFQTQDPVFLSLQVPGVLWREPLEFRAKKNSLLHGAFPTNVDVARRSGKEADGLEVEQRHIDPELIDQKLSTRQFDVITLVHNETSCGMMNPLEDISLVAFEIQLSGCNFRDRYS